MKCSFTRLRMVCLSLTLHFCLQSHTRWSCCMIPVQTLRTQTRSLLLTLLSATLHECRCGCARRAANSASLYPLTPAHADTLQHPPSSELWGSRVWAPHGEVPPLPAPACSAAASLTSCLIVLSIFC